MQPSQDMQDVEFAPMGSGKRVRSSSQLFSLIEQPSNVFACNAYPACVMCPDFRSVCGPDPIPLLQYAQKGYAKKGYKAPGKMRRLA